MLRNNIAELSEILAKYLIRESGELSPSLDQDFEEALRLAPKKPLARALAVAFRSCQTPSFPSMVGILYHSSPERRFRAELLNNIFALVPEVPVDNFILKRSKTALISPDDTDDVSAEKVVEIASAAESIKSEVVVAVSEYYARRRSLLVNLDTSTRSLILTTLASELGGSRAGEAVFRPVPPSVTSADALAPVEPVPPPRYASVQIFGERFPGDRGSELGKDQPLKENEWYQFEISVRVDPIGVPPVEERRPIREPQQSGPVDIIVTAEADGFEMEEQVSKLVLPPKGNSTEHAIFRMMPVRHSKSETDLLRIRFRLFYKFNLLEEFTVRAEVVSSLDDDLVSVFGRSPAVELNHERLRQSDFNDFDHITPVCLHIHIESYHGRYRLKFTLKHPERLDALAFVTEVRLTAAQLATNIVGVRKSLFRVCSSDTFNVSVDGSDSEFKNHLQELSESGSDLWALLFDRGQGQGASVVGKWLRENPPPDGSKIQVSIAGGASTFTFPWSLLYDQPCCDNSPRSEQGFWGMRYVIEQRPVALTLSPAQTLSERPELEIGALYWKFAQTPQQQKYLLSLLAERKKINLATGKPIDDANSAYQYLRNCSSQIVYFFTHGHTGLPDGESYGVTVEDFLKVYDRLSPEIREATKYIFQDIAQRRYRSDESFIELTTGRLELRRLYREVEKLPMKPLVILNMCDSAQVTPSLSRSFIDFFLSRGARAVIGTECSMRPTFADFVCRRLLSALFQGQPIGEALRQLRIEAAGRKNLLGLAYTLFGVAEAALGAGLLL